MGDTKLLPCPCCEYDAAFRHEHNRDCSQTWIECSGCGLQSARYHWLGNDDGQRKTLAGVWNTRPALLARQEGEETVTFGGVTSRFVDGMGWVIACSDVPHYMRGMVEKMSAARSGGGG